MKKGLLLMGLVAVFGFSKINAQTATTQPNPNQTQLLEEVNAAPGELKIAYKKYRLPNGLTLIVHEDHSDPIVHVEVTYHVGSARESAGKSGFAHFFEHMMFQGSLNVKDEEHFKIVQGAGGQMNGTTNRDRTNYFETLPANYLETALWLEADRMGFLLDSVTQKKFEVQRATVKNEKGQRIDNVPYGKVDEIKDAALYPKGHSYNWPVIGYLEDLDRVDVNDLKNFFMRWYGPNNACVVVSGDVNAADVVKLTEKYFGPIPRGPEVKPMRLEQVKLPDTRYANYADNVYAKMFNFVWPTPKTLHQDEAALDILSYILGVGNNSILYQTFMKDIGDKPQRAIQAASYNYGSELAGEFTINIVDNPGYEFMMSEKNDIEKTLLEMFVAFDKKGVNDDDLLRAKAQYESSYYGILSTVGSKASVLSQTWYLSHGNPKLDKGYNIGEDLARYQKVTKEDVMRVFRQYIKDKNFVLVTAFPKQNKDAAKEEAKETTTSGTVVKGELEYKGLSYTKPTDNFDRSKRPDPGAAKPSNVPDFYTANWNNGIKVIGTKIQESPMITLLLSMKGGNIAAGDPSKTGLANLTASVMGEATQNYTTEAFENELSKLGASISFGAGTDNHYMQVSTPKKNLDATLKLMEEKLMRPKFNQDEFKQNQTMAYQYVNSSKYDAATTANMAFAKLVYGKSIAAEPVMGTIKSIKTFTVKDVQNYYNKYYAPDFATLTIVGEIDQNEIFPKLKFLQDWGKKNVVIPAVPSPVAAPGSDKTVMLVDKYKASQSEIRVGMLGQKYDYNGKFFKTNAMNYPLGGSFNSRLNMNLREEKGFTYGIGSGNSGYKDRVGVYQISTGVRTSATDSALKEIMYEVKNYRDNGITDDELDFMKKSITQSDALRYESPGQKASFLNRLVEFDLPKDYIKQQNATINSLSKEEINALAKEVLKLEQMTILIVGDKEKIKAPLEKAGYRLVDYKEVEVASYEKN
jgi:zinc protease